jgi:hypothetical protein
MGIDSGEDVSEYLDYSKATQPGNQTNEPRLAGPYAQKAGLRIGLRGVTRQSLVKMWLNEKLTSSRDEREED